MKRLDDTTLELIAETICGNSSGAGGADYASPSPYRTMWEVRKFFQRAGVTASGESTTRKWFALESLQHLNRDAAGSLVPNGIERTLLRLANPLEYRNDSAACEAVRSYLNQALIGEGLEIVLVGVASRLAPRTPATQAHHAAHRRDPAPDFQRVVSSPDLAEILTFRWEEAERCVTAGAHLAAVVMMGSILEGTLLHRVENEIAAANRAAASPKDKNGKPKPIQDWGIGNLIDVAHELGWLQGDMRRFSHALRESRNIVHPYVQRLRRDTPDRDTCAICWQVVRAGVSDILNFDAADKQPRGGA